MALRNQEIAQRIKHLREQRGNPPQPVVAAAVGVSLRTYQNWEGGDAKPEYRNLEQLAAYFKVSEEFILSGTEHSRPESPVVVSEQIGAMADEFRRYVDEMLTLLREARSERGRIEEVITAQQGILEEIQRVAAEFPAAVEMEALRAELTRIEERDRAAEAERRESAAAARRARRRGA